METTDGKSMESAMEKKPDGRGRSPGSRRTQFASGHRPHRATLEGPPQETPTDGVPLLLTVMRWVLDHPKGEDRTEYQKHVRAWLKEDHKGFFSRYAELEKAALGARNAEGAPTDGTRPPSVGEICPTCGMEYVGPDEGVERCLELLDQQLREKPWLKDR